MDYGSAINIAIGCVVASYLDIASKTKLIDTLREIKEKLEKISEIKESNEEIIKIKITKKMKDKMERCSCKEEWKKDDDCAGCCCSICVLNY